MSPAAAEPGLQPNPPFSRKESRPPPSVVAFLPSSSRSSLYESRVEKPGHRVRVDSANVAAFDLRPEHELDSAEAAAFDSRPE